MLIRMGAGLGANYWKLWASSAMSNLADGVFLIAIPLLAVRLTDSPVLIAGLVFSMRLPWLLFALVAGALADRLDRRRTMVIVQLLRAGLAGGLALSVLLGVENLVLLYVVAFVLGVGETLFDTAAQSVMPALVKREQLATANGRLYAVEIITNQFIGPPLGGLLAAGAMVAAFGLSAAGWLAAGLLLVAIVGSFRPVREGPPTGIRTDIAEGLRYLFGHRLLRSLAIMVGVMNLSATAAFSIFVLYAVAPGPMGLSEPEFGLLLTTGAVGSIAGSVLAAGLVRRFGRARMLVAAIVASGLTVATPALTPNFFAVGAAFMVGGGAGVVWNVITVSFRQGIIPDRLLGRANSAYRLLAWGTMPVGALVGGLLGELLGLPAVFLLAGVATMTLLIFREVLDDRVLDAAEAQAAAGRPAEAEAGTPADRPADASA